MIPRLKKAGTKMQPVDIVPMFQPMKMQGFQSYPEPSSLPPEVFAILNNIRLSKGVITARDGDASSGTYSDYIATGSYSVRGCFECIQNSTPSIFVAVGNGTTGYVYRSIDEGATWSEVTTAGTRLTDSTTNPVFFALILDNSYIGTTNTDVVMIQNGIDLPRIYAYTPNTTTYVMSIQFQPAAIDSTSVLNSQPAFLQYFPIALSPTEQYTFTFASGVSSPPAVNDTYTNSGATYTVVSVNITGGAGTIVFSGEVVPPASGALTRATGSGTTPINYTSVAYGFPYSNTGATPPTLSYPQGSGAQATVTLNSTGGISSVAVGAGGSGYNPHTLAYPTGGGGNGGGILNVTVSAGAVSAVAPYSSGIGAYNTVPGVNFVSDCLLLTIPANCTQNSTATISFATVIATGTVAGSVMTVSSMTGVNGFSASGSFVVGMPIKCGSLPSGTVISSFGTGTGGIGTYNLSSSATIASPTTITGGNGLNMSNATQLTMIVDQIRPLDYNLIYQNLAVSITDAWGNVGVCFNPLTSQGTEIVLNYPSVAQSNASTTTSSGSATVQPVTINSLVSASGTATQQSGSGNASMIAYALPTFSGTTSFDFKHIQSVTFTYVGTVGTATDLAIYMMAAGGNTQGGARYGVCLYDSNSRSIGPGTIITNTINGLPGFYSGGTYAPGITIMEDPRFFYDYVLSVPSLSAAQITQGLDNYLLFREDNGQTYYYYTAAYPATDVGTQVIIESNYPSLSVNLGATLDFAQPLPYATALTTPIGTAMETANGRTLVCAGNTLYISDFEQPFTFTLAQRFLAPGEPDPLSGTTQERVGETFQQIVALGAIPSTSGQSSGPLTGTSTIYVWTDSNFYQIPGFSSTGLNTLSLVGSHGTLSPYSPARLRTAVFWLDQQNEICQFSAGITILYGTNIPDMQIHILSLFRVDDQLKAIPAGRLPWVCGSVNNNRYYLSYTPNGATENTACMVWSDQQGLFESIDSYGLGGTKTNAAFTLPYFSTSGYTKILYFGSDGTGAYTSEYEVPGNTNPVALNVTFRELNNQFTKLIEMDTVQIAGSALNGAFTVTTNRVFDGNTSKPVSSYISFTSGQVATKVDIAPVGGTGNRVYLYVQGNIPGGSDLLMISAKVKTLEGSYKR